MKKQSLSVKLVKLLSVAFAIATLAFAVYFNQSYANQDEMILPQKNPDGIFLVTAATGIFPLTQKDYDKLKTYSLENKVFLHATKAMIPNINKKDKSDIAVIYKNSYSKYLIAKKDLNEFLKYYLSKSQIHKSK